MRYKLVRDFFCPDPEWYFPEPDPAKILRSDRIRIRNTALLCTVPVYKEVALVSNYLKKLKTLWKPSLVVWAQIVPYRKFPCKLFPTSFLREANQTQLSTVYHKTFEIFGKFTGAIPIRCFVNLLIFLDFNVGYIPRKKTNMYDTVGSYWWTCTPRVSLRMAKFYLFSSKLSMFISFSWSWRSSAEYRK
jgi:hypothetical protein